MSLIRTNGANVRVTVVLRSMRKNARGQLVPVETGRVECAGRLSPATEADVERYASSGPAVEERTRFTTCSFPGDALSQVVTGDGRVWEVVGAPRRYAPSRATTRDIVMLSAKTQKRRA